VVEITLEGKNIENTSVIYTLSYMKIKWGNMKTSEGFKFRENIIWNIEVSYFFNGKVLHLEKQI
jgi:hypothetical protein